jgi:hypothetical protein
MRGSRGLSGKLIAACLVIILAAPLAETAAAQQQEALSGQQAQEPASGSQGAQTGTPQSTPDQTQNSTKPVGTAVAPLENNTGIAASRPAGAVIAPSKQRRARTILIRVGVIVAAAVAVGVVVGLSKTSNGRPNN